MKNSARTRLQNPVGIAVFAERLRTLRRAKLLSQQALADQANIERSTISRIENETMVPSLDVLISLSRALMIELGELVSDPAITRSDEGQ